MFVFTVQFESMFVDRHDIDPQTPRRVTTYSSGFFRSQRFDVVNLVRCRITDRGKKFQNLRLGEDQWRTQPWGSDTEHKMGLKNLAPAIGTAARRFAKKPKAPLSVRRVPQATDSGCEC